jgi:hypothetical protein
MNIFWKRSLRNLILNQLISASYLESESLFLYLHR